MTGGWIRGKPVTTLMRKLMDGARDEDVLVTDDTQEFYASLILEWWGSLRVRRERDRSLRVRLTNRGRDVLYAAFPLGTN